MSGFTYTTRYPILTHRGDELLPAGAILDETTLFGLGKRPFDRRTFPFGFSETVRNDLGDFLDNQPYAAIFRGKASRDNVFAMLEKVLIPQGMVEVVEYFREKDFYTYRHMLVVFALSTHLVSLLSPNGDFSKSIFASPAHDIGKYTLPIDLLLKATPLTASEHDHVKHHTVAGYALVHYFTDGEGTDLASRVARDHHERCDGSGYPAGISSIDRMIEIVIASDMYDALVSPRPYRNAPFDNRSALEELSSKVLHGKISKETVQALVASNRESCPHWSECGISGEKRGIPPEGNNYGLIADDK